jgi:hypothetical protein
MKAVRIGTMGLDTTSPFTITNVDSVSNLYIGQRVTLTATDMIPDGYYTVSVISGSSVTVTGNAISYTIFARAPLSVSIHPILVFDHGHPLEIVNTILQYTQHDTLKFEAFPRICLFHDFEEKITFEKQVSLNLVIVTDTAPEYSAPQRYTYSFDPILIPLYDLFIKQLSFSDNIQPTEGNNYFKHSKWDRLYWGKDGLYGNTANIFNDFIDAIEINNLEIKIIETCIE